MNSSDTSFYVFFDNGDYVKEEARIIDLLGADVYVRVDVALKIYSTPKLYVSSEMIFKIPDLYIDLSIEELKEVFPHEFI